MLQPGLLWYRKFRSDLEGLGFHFNKYDPCVANRTVRGNQQTIRFHVDDVLSSHIDAVVNDDFAEWAQNTYGSYKPVEVHRGKIHHFLGMTLDFSKKGEVHVTQIDHIDEMIEEFPDDLGNGSAATPATNSLFEKGEGKPIDSGRKEIFHRITAKGLFISNRSRPDIMPTVSVLCGRVRDPNKNDWDKCKRLVKYLKNTKDLHLVLRYDGCAIARWHVDASFAVHSDFKSHSGGVLLMHPEGGGMASGSTKQKINARSSTEAEIVACDDFLAKVVWVRNFLMGQGIPLKENFLGQDNKSAIILEEKGRASLGKRSRAMNVRYFAIKDHVDRGEVTVHYCPTEKMVGDFFTKPLQGEKFRNFRRLILGM